MSESGLSRRFAWHLSASVSAAFDFSWSAAQAVHTRTPLIIPLPAPGEGLSGVPVVDVNEQIAAQTRNSDALFFGEKLALLRSSLPGEKMTCHNWDLECRSPSPDDVLL
jgi:hypothetical protein